MFIDIYKFFRVEMNSGSILGYFFASRPDYYSDRNCIFNSQIHFFEAKEPLYSVIFGDYAPVVCVLFDRVMQSCHFASKFLAILF